MFLEDDIKTGYVNSHSKRLQKKKKKNLNWNAGGALGGIFFFLLLFQSIKSHSKQNAMHNKKKSISNLCLWTVEPSGVFNMEPCTISMMFSKDVDEL